MRKKIAIITLKYLLYTVWIARLGFVSQVVGVLATEYEIYLQFSKISSNFKYFSFLLYGKVVMIFFNSYLITKLVESDKMVYIDQLYLLLSVVIGGCLYIFKPKLYVYACASMSVFVLGEILYVAYEWSLLKTCAVCAFVSILLKINVAVGTTCLNHALVSYLLAVQLTNGEYENIPILASIVYTAIVMYMKRIKHNNINKL